jgi:hypothetical protein
MAVIQAVYLPATNDSVTLIQSGYYFSSARSSYCLQIAILFNCPH